MATFALRTRVVAVAICASGWLGPGVRSSIAMWAVVSVRLYLPGVLVARILAWGRVAMAA